MYDAGTSDVVRSGTERWEIKRPFGEKGSWWCEKGLYEALLGGMS